MVLLCILVCIGASLRAAPPEVQRPLSGARIVRGPTPIPNGKCKSPNDLTLQNERVAFSFAVDTERPWGNPAGAILDGGLVTDGVVGKDRLSYVDFLPDGWKPWAQTKTEFRILHDGPERAVLEATRDFLGNPLVTTWTLVADSPALQVETVLRNSSGQPLSGLHSGYSFCTKNADVFVPQDILVPEAAAPPIDGTASASQDISVGDSVLVSANAWVAGYGPDWSGSLRFFGADLAVGGKTWRDLYAVTSLADGEEVRLSATLRMEPSPDISDFHADAARAAGLPLGGVSGVVRTTGGQPVPGAFVMAETRDGKVVSWATADSDGKYAVELPVGRWRLRAAATDHASPPGSEVDVIEGRDQPLDFDGLREPGTVRLSIELAGCAIDAQRYWKGDVRIERIGPPPPVRHLERFVTFSSADDPGEATLACPPGEQVFLVSYGAGFFGPPKQVRLVVPSGGTASADVLVPVEEIPSSRGWYCADLHHHSDHADGATSPALLVLAQSAAGLDFAFVSDHDFVGNNEEIARLADERGMGFLSGIEVSPSFSHFNLFPLPPGANPGIDSSNTTPQAIIARARELGVLIQANHPMESGNAYLRSHDQGTLPGPYSEDFDFIELNAEDGFDASDQEAVRKAFGFFDAGSFYWLTAGSDTHDALTYKPDEGAGKVRTCVYLHTDSLIPDHPCGPPAQRSPAVSAERLADALRAGRAVATFGPLVFPGFLPGSTVAAAPDGTVLLPAAIYAAAGIAEVRVHTSSGIAWANKAEGCPARLSVTAAPPASGASWFVLEVVDCAGNPAFVNPVRLQSL
jgi:hypothetical protein